MAVATHLVMDLHHRIAALLSLATVVACSNKPRQPPAPAPLSGHREHAMRHCPSGVTGAITTMAATPDSVDLTIVSRDPAATKEIVARARAHVALGAPTGV